MKKIYCAAAIALLAVASCSNESELTVVNNQTEQATAPVTVRVSDFSVSQSEIPSTKAAQSAASYTGVGAVTLAFYDGEGTEVYNTTQVRGDGSYTTFGEFTANLPVGHYTMVAIGRGRSEGDVFVLTSPTQAAYTSERVRETFTVVQDVMVTDAAPLDLEVTLNRVITRLNILSTDNVPSGTTTIRTTYAKGSKSFNPTTGLATDDAGFTVTNSVNINGEGHLAVFNVAFLATDEETMTVTIEALDADANVLSTRVVPNVPLKRNRQTTLTGAVFTADESAAAFQFETAWITGNTVEF